MYRDSERTGPMSPQLALRVAIIGGVALVMFGLIFFRLWYLQILSGDQYLAEANNNRVREVTLEAPRGKIVDRDGNVLVDNVPGNAVKISPEKLPRDSRGKTVLYARLSKVLGENRRTLRKDVQDQINQQPFSAATVKADAPYSVVAYLKERAQQFPGVTVEQTSFRRYPRHTLAAQLVGYVGQVSEDALKQKIYPGVKQGDRVGIAGIESSYDKYLRGRNGATRIQVDSQGNPHGELTTRVPVPGRQLKLTLDLAVQKTGQAALGNAKAAFVVMDIKTGAVRALGSTPSFDPNVFSKTIKQSDYSKLTSEANGAPLTNRAIQGLYPTGSTFKLITSVAALQSGLITPNTVINDGGSLRVGNVVFRNSGGVVNGAVALRKALQVSSDVFFYTLGRDDNGRFAIQKWAHKLGLGRKTGIDLPPATENAGLVPSEKWRNKRFNTKLKNGQRLGDRPWSVGDNVNLAVGQGDLQANPLQMATAYAAIGNGGYLVTPHLGERVEDSDGAAIQEFPTPPRRKVGVRPEYRQAIMDGLHQAAESPGGTSYPIFKGFPIQVAGKTGTAQKGLGRPDQSWYIVMAPYPNPRYVVAVTSEAGGFGADTAAPAACKILSTLLNVRKKGACTGGTASPTGAAAQVAKAN
jgi:penicillin-binding protein 2